MYWLPGLLLITGFCSALPAQEKKAWSARSIGVFKHNERVNHAVLSPDGKVLVSMASGKGKAELKIWDTATGKELEGPTWSKGNPAAAFSGDGSRILFTGDSGKKLMLWDIEKKQIVAEADSLLGSSYSIGVSRDGFLFASAGYETLGVYQTKSGNSLLSARVNRHNFMSGTFAPDLKYYAEGNSQDIDLWDLSGKPTRIFGEHRGVVRRIAFSRDAKSLVAASIRSSGFKGVAQVKFWDIATGKDLWTFETETRQVFHLDLSPNEKSLAIQEYTDIDAKTEVALYDVPSGKQTFRLKDIQTRFVTPTFVTDDRVLTLGLVEKAVQLWEMSR